MLGEMISDTDVLTVTVLLPSSEGERQEVFEHIANNGDLCGCPALGAMHGNAINFFRAAHALQEHEEAESIVERLRSENAHQIRNALAKTKSLTLATGDSTQVGRGHGLFKVSLMMFSLGFLVCYNFVL